MPEMRSDRVLRGNPEVEELQFAGTNRWRDRPFPVVGRRTEDRREVFGM